MAARARQAFPAGKGNLDEIARSRLVKVHRGVVGAAPPTSTRHAHAAFNPARQMMATDGNRLVRGIQSSRCARPRTRCSLAGAGARDSALSLSMRWPGVAGDWSRSAITLAPPALAGGPCGGSRSRHTASVGKLAGPGPSAGLVSCAGAEGPGGKALSGREHRALGLLIMAAAVRSPGSGHGVAESSLSGEWRPPGRPWEVSRASRC